MASIGNLPPPTTLIGSGKTTPGDLYGLRPEEILKQPEVTLGDGLIPHADYGLKTPTDLAGLRADLLKRLAAKLPRGAK